MNVANMITIFRIILVPVYLYVFFNSGSNGLFYGGMIFILAGITDVLDGYIARNYDQITKLGSVLDPLADKLMSFAVLISFTYANIIPSWILKVIGLKELAMITGAVVLYLFKGNKVLPANKYGKIATLAFYISIVMVIFRLPNKIIKISFIITVALNLIAFLNYLIIFMKMDSNSNNMI